jgi:hypothetical protein
MPDNRLVGAVVAFVSLAAAFYVFSSHLTSLKQEALLEVFRFLLFSCAVSGVLILYKSMEAESRLRMQDQKAVEEFRKDFLAAYHQLKMVRRDFRFTTSVKEDQLGILDTERFANAYHLLNNAYVEFELLRKTISGTSGAFKNISAQIEADMRSVDKYIRKIMIELENIDWKAANTVPVSDVELFYSFLYTDGNPVHVASSKSLDRFLVLATQK